MALKWSKNCNCAEYLENALKLLKKEEERIDSCLSAKYNIGIKMIKEFDYNILIFYKPYLLGENGIYSMLVNNQKEVFRKINYYYPKILGFNYAIYPLW